MRKVNVRNFIFWFLVSVLSLCFVLLVQSTHNVAEDASDALESAQTLEAYLSARETEQAGAIENTIATIEAIPTETATPTETSKPTITPTPTPDLSYIEIVSVFLGGDYEPTRPDRGMTGINTDVFVIVILIVPNYEALPFMVTLFAVPRDLYVDVACYPPGWLEYGARINSAYGWGGLDCVRNTVRRNFDLEVNGPIIYTDFLGFILMINGMGGIEITPTKTYTDTCIESEGDFKFYKTWKAGETYHMAGEDALCYARGRSGFGPQVFDPGIDRNRRHLEVLLAIGDKLREVMKDAPDLLGLIEAAWRTNGKYVHTNFGLDDLLLFADLINRPYYLEYFTIDPFLEADYYRTVEYNASVLMPTVMLPEWTRCMIDFNDHESCSLLWPQ